MMVDLNTLLKPGFTYLYLLWGDYINSRGEITGGAYNRSNGEVRAYLAIPCDAGHADNAGCAGGPQGVASAQNGRAWLPSPSPQGVRALLERRLSGRFAAGLMNIH